jgi:hypothetical protein
VLYSVPMRERLHRFVKNIVVALGHTMLEEPEAVSIVVLVGIVVVLVCAFIFPAYAVIADARPEILSINPDKLL